MLCCSYVLKVDGFCLPWEVPCGGNWGCYTEQQRCDGYWHCPNGRDELNCSSCQEEEFPCSRNGACYPRSDRCNYQNRCPNGSDEKNCFFCQPGNFHCKVPNNKIQNNTRDRNCDLIVCLTFDLCRITAVCLSRGFATLRTTVATAVMRRVVPSSFPPESSPPPSSAASSAASCWSSPSAAPANSTRCACSNAGEGHRPLQSESDAELCDSSSVIGQCVTLTFLLVDAGHLRPSCPEWRRSY